MRSRAVTRERLFPRDVNLAGLPLQAKMLGRIAIGCLSGDDLRTIIACGAIPAKDDPDATHAIFTQGW
jgi:hypothetical protein